MTPDQVRWFADAFARWWPTSSRRSSARRTSSGWRSPACCPRVTCCSRTIPGTGKTLAGQGDREHGAGHAQPDPVHARPAAQRRHRRHHLRPAHAGSSSSTAGPIFATIVLADEINRASPKTQSALLEVMEEGQVTVDGVSPPGRPAVHGHRHPEPHRAGRHLPAARGAARPVPDEDQPRLPRPRLDRGAARRRRRPATAPPPSSPSSPPRRSATWPQLADQVHVDPAVLGYVSQLAEESRRLRRTSGSGLRSAAAWPTCGPPRPGLPRTAATTCCPTTSRTWPCPPQPPAAARRRGRVLRRHGRGRHRPAPRPGRPPTERAA